MTALGPAGIGVADLCQEGDKLLETGELGKATALYISAFKSHAGSTMGHMRGLGGSRLARVISTLETWLNGHGEIQASMEGLNKGLAAVFLSTLSPNNVSASLFKMESILQGAGQGCDEIVVRCSALLEGKQNPCREGSTCVVLELTRALTCLLSDPYSPKGPRLYLKAFQDNKSETVRLVKGRQAQHLPKIVKAFSEQILPKNTEIKSRERASEVIDIVAEAASEFLEFLMAVSPGDTDVQELQATFLFSLGKFEESADVYSVALQDHSQSQPKSGTGKVVKGMPAERRASLLTCRAAAHFSTGGRATESSRDLGEAFGVHPATARLQFQRLFVDQGTGAAARMQLRQQAERGLLGYRETVLVRLDLRSSEGVELLDPVIAQLWALCHLESDGGSRELRVRLAECLLLRGEFREALSICSQLATHTNSHTQHSYQNTVQVLRGYSRLLSDDHKGALEDFQTVIEHKAPHPSSCVRALCGRGVLRMMGGLHYLTALDYVTASRLQPQDTALTVRCLVPWNCRGLLLTVLLEQARVMLEEWTVDHSSSLSPLEQQEHQQTKQLQPTQTKDVGVHSLAVLLMELQPSADAPQILVADALYLLGRMEEAYRLLLAIGPNSPRAPILVRLTLLQLHRGFHNDANQLLKKLIQCGDTSCLRPLLAVASKKDRLLLQGYCHSASKRILEGLQGECTLRQAVAYLSIAIMASGCEAANSLMERARCYVLLGQRKTAIFDFSSILKEHPDHVQALCGRGFTYLIANIDILAALQISMDAVTKDILSLKDKARKLVCDWLQCHLLYVDILLAKGEIAGAHLAQVFGQDPREAAAQARVGVVEAWQQNYCGGGARLSKLTEKEPSTLDFLLTLIPPIHRKRMAQAAAHEAGSVSASGHWEQALALLTVAVQAVAELQPQFLRQRAACLAQLDLHERAVADLDRVIQSHGDPSDATVSGAPEEPHVWADDLCQRGRSLVLCSHEGPALDDFSRALELHRGQALQCVEAGLGRSRLAECFLRMALQHYGEQQLSKAWRLTESGLLVDSEHMELRRLRARVKREHCSPCIVH
uniref:Tetratricopeptide repeat protein 34 n=1 Tax=Oncorhynchus tshawytscha TaxID=74940 RepID=A0A8C8M0G2_ONCTS